MMSVVGSRCPIGIKVTAVVELFVAVNVVVVVVMVVVLAIVAVVVCDGGGGGAVIMVAVIPEAFVNCCC